MKKSKMESTDFSGWYVLIESYSICELVLVVEYRDIYLYNHSCPTPHRTPSPLVVFTV